MKIFHVILIGLSLSHFQFHVTAIERPDAPIPKRIVFALSIDGGGVRGIIPARILHHIEQRVEENIRKIAENQIHEILGGGIDICYPDPNVHLAKGFDIMGGTSTGGIIVLGLNKPDSKNPEYPEYKSEKLLELYKEKSATIFSAKGDGVVNKVWPGVNTSKWSAAPLEVILKDYFGDKELKDCLSDVIITTYRLEKEERYAFRADKARKDPDYHNFSMFDVARATSAAPTFFPEHIIKTKALNTQGQPYYQEAVVDGGVVENNPALMIYHKVRESFPKSQIVLLSIGTGESKAGNLTKTVQNGGKYQWGAPLIDLMMRHKTYTTHKELDRERRRNASYLKSYIRIQPTLNPGEAELDKTDPDYLQKLIKYADESIKDQSIKIALDNFIIDFSNNYFEQKLFVFFPELASNLEINNEQCDFKGNEISPVLAWEIGNYLKKIEKQPTRLNFQGKNMNYQSIKLLVHSLNNIKSMNISNNKIEIEKKIHIPQFKAITKLDIDYNSLGSTGIKNLVPWIPNVTDLSIAGNNIGDNGLFFVIQNLEQLVNLNIAENKITEAGAEQLIRVGRIIKLNMTYNIKSALGIRRGLRPNFVDGLLGRRNPLSEIDISSKPSGDLEKLEESLLLYASENVILKIDGLRKNIKMRSRL